jgi:hypothetical protein
MGMPALKLEFEEVTVEDGLSRLPTAIEHLQSDVSEIKGDIRLLHGKTVDKSLSAKIEAVDQRLADKIEAVDQRLSDKIDAVDQKLSAKIDAVDQKLSAKIEAVDKSLSARIDAVKDSLAAQAVSTEKSFSKQVVWIVGVAATLLTAMARGFHWL